MEELQGPNKPPLNHGQNPTVPRNLRHFRPPICASRLISRTIFDKTCGKHSSLVKYGDYEVKFVTAQTNRRNRRKNGRIESPPPQPRRTSITPDPPLNSCFGVVFVRQLFKTYQIIQSGRRICMPSVNRRNFR
jgi:hypothetical protein